MRLAGTMERACACCWELWQRSRGLITLSGGAVVCHVCKSHRHAVALDDRTWQYTCDGCRASCVVASRAPGQSCAQTEFSTSHVRALGAAAWGRGAAAGCG